MGKGPIPHLNLAGGIDQSGKPHTVKEGKWWDSLNYRHGKGAIVQIPRLLTNAAVPASQRITAIRTLPMKHYNRVAILMFAGGRVYSFNSNAIKTLATGGDNSFLSGGPYSRWAAMLHGDRCYFTNRESPIAYTDGHNITKFTLAVPSGRYLNMFMDHLVVGNVKWQGVIMPGRFMWSDLNKIGTWNPARSNEADFFDCRESATGTDEVGGITGQARMNEVFITYTPSVIYETRYVGLPRVMLTTQRFSGVGCDFIYGLITGESLHFFPCKRLQLFFVYDGNSPQVLPSDLASYFFADLSTDPHEQQMTWGYLDESNNEAIWVYMSKANSGMVYDRAIHYNFVEKIWFRSSVSNISSFGGGAGFQYKSIANYFNAISTVTNDALPGSCDTLDLFSPATTIPRMYGGALGQIYTEQRNLNPVDEFIPYARPLLETGDMLYEQPDKVKETESMVIDAVATNGVELFTAKRDYLTDPVNWVAAPQKWFSTLVQKRLSFPRVAGRIIRYRFQPVVATYIPTIREIFLHVEIQTQVYRNVVQVLDSTTPASGYITHLPAGDSNFVLIGAGGGGGCATAGAWHTYVPTEDATHKAIQGVTRRKIYGKEYLGILQTNLLRDTDSSLTVFGPVYIPIPGNPDPNTIMSQEQKDYLYNAAIAFVENSNLLFKQYLNVSFVQMAVGATGSVNGFLWSTYAAGDRTSTALPANAWYIVVDWGTYDYGAQYGYDTGLRYAGGGGGGYLALRFSASGGGGESIFYNRGNCGNHTVAGTGFATKGADGIKTQLKYNAENPWAGGGTGGGDNGGGYVTGSGGANSLAGIAVFSVVQNTVGEAGTAQSPSSGVPATIAKGGRGYDIYGVKQASTKPSSRGLGYGGGGCGRYRDYLAYLNGTRGAEGLIWFGYRLGPDGVSCEYPGIGANVNKIASKQTSVAATTLNGSGGNVNVTFRVSGVWEEKAYSGGTLVSTSVNKNGTPAADNRSIAKLVIGADTYYLNRGVSPQQACVTTTYVFTITIPGNSLLTLTLDNIDTKQIEPRDITKAAIVTAAESDLLEPQWVTVTILTINAAPDNAEPLTEFVAFTENIYSNAAEK